MPSPTRAHDWHVGHVALPQHAPSTQLLLMHCAAAVQVCPLTDLQAPAPLHTLVPVQALTGLLSVAPLTRFEQVPAVAILRLHVWHVGQLELPQQTPSTQLALKHCVPALQLCPFPSLQAPDPLQMLVPVHALAGTLSVVPLGRNEQVPLPERPHDWHVGQLAVPQQAPSRQLELKHSALEPQVCPFAFLQLPAPSHTLVPEQALTGLLSTAPLVRFEQVPAVAALRLQV